MNKTEFRPSADRPKLIQNMEQNRQAIFDSTLLAKAVIRHLDNSIEVITVFELSTIYDFFWTFNPKSKNKRAPKKGWGKARASFARHHATHDYSNVPFAEFVRQYAASRKAEVLTVRVYKARTLAAVQAKPAHQSVGADWTPRENSTDMRDYKYQNRRLDAKISGRSIDPSWTGRK